MKSRLVPVLVAALLSTCSLFPGASFAAAHHTLRVHTAPATIKCQYCGMIMTQHKSAHAPVAVKIHGTTYYCCTKCPMGTGALRNSAHHSMASMAPATMKCKYCGMIMTQHKSAGAPVAVKIHGTTYYCCRKCPMGSGAMHKSMSHTTANKMCGCMMNHKM